MASLQQTIQQNKQNPLLTRDANGVLTQQTGEELQGLAGKAGLVAPPTTPAGTAMIGGTPDQQKMAGTPQQKQAALTMSQSSQNDLATTEREAQARTQQTGQEQQSQQKSQNLQSLGGLGDRVQQFINTQRQNMANTANSMTGVTIGAADQPAGVGTTPTAAATTAADGTTTSTATTASLLQQVNPADLDKFKSLLADFSQNPSNMQDLVDAGNLIGGHAIDPTEVPSLYQTADQVAQSSAASSMADTMNVSNLFQQPEFGYTPDQLSSLLNVPQDQLQNYTIKQLEDKVREVTANEFSGADQLDKQAQSTQLGTAEQGLAQQAGREASATGMRSTDADMKNLESQIAQGQQISFGGKQYALEDLLKDDTVTQIVGDYLNNPDSPDSQKLAATEPQLVALVDKNKALFSDAMANIQAGTQQFGDIQTQNAALSTVGNTKIDDSIMAAAIPNYGKLAASAQTLDPNTALGAVKAMPADQGQAVVTGMDSIVADHPEFASQFAGLSADELNQLGIDKNSPKWQALQANIQTNDQLKKLDPTDQAGVLNAYFGMPVDPAQAQSYISETAARKALSLPAGYYGLLDKDGDGKLDDPATLLKSMQDATQPATLKDAIAGNIQTFDKGQMSTPPLSGVQGQLFQKLGQYAADGTIDSSDIKSAFGASSAPSDMDMMMYLQKTPISGSSNDMKSQLNSQLTTARVSNANSALQDMVKKGYSEQQQLDQLTKLITGSGTYTAGQPNLNYVDKDTLSSQMSTLADKLSQEMQDAATAAAKNKLNSQAQRLGDPAYADLGRDIETVGKILGNQNLVNQGKTVDSDYLNATKEFIKAGYGTQKVTKPVANAVSTVAQDYVKPVTSLASAIKKAKF